MTTITEKISSKKKVIHRINNDFDVNPKTYSSLLLLNHYYSELDVSFGYEDDWRYYFIVRRHFLRKVAKRDENGNRYWVCHYCNEPIYKMQKRNTKGKQRGCVTVDHVIPVSDPNCDKLDTKNMVECCDKCNKEKKDMPYVVFMLRKKN